MAQFYGGDFDGRNGIVINNDAYVYDDFDVDGAGWMVTGIYANCLTMDEISSMNWEIRSGISEGNGGTLVAGGSGPITQTLTGRSGFGYDEYELRISGLDLHLAAGTYYVGVNVGGPPRQTFVSTTSGANGFGSPLGNGNSWFDSDFWNEHFRSIEELLGKGPWDFSYGLVPEPATLAALGVALTALATRRRGS